LVYFVFIIENARSKKQNSYEYENQCKVIKNAPENVRD